MVKQAPTFLDSRILCSPGGYGAPMPDQQHSSPVPPRPLAYVTVALASFVLVACSSSTSGKPRNGGPGNATTSAAATSAPATTAAPATHGAPGKADFLTAANAVCKATYTKVHALPIPTGPSDYPAIIAFGQATLKLFPPFAKKIRALVARSADKAELTAQWIGPDETSFKAQEPLLKQLVAAAKAKQADRVQQLLTQLDNMPDPSKKIATFMTGYGLTECAKLEVF